jgi:hypothetical protein
MIGLCGANRNSSMNNDEATSIVRQELMKYRSRRAFVPLSEDFITGPDTVISATRRCGSTERE